MTTIRRLTDSCLLVTTDTDATLFDPGSHTFDSGEFDLATLGDVSRVCITHEHGDHVKPEFVRWLIDRRADVTVHTNDAVARILGSNGIDATTEPPPDARFEDVLHEEVPTGATPPNRAFTLGDVFTHPGDSHQPSRTGTVLALPLLAPWTSVTKAVAFARRLRPEMVVPIHDFYLSAEGRRFVRGMAGNVLKGENIELVPLDWGGSFTV